MSKFVDLTGRKFERLLVIKKSHSTDTGVMWFCKCDCGKEVVVRGGALTSGNNRSCGCYKREQLINVRKVSNTRHGMRGTPTYVSWIEMRRRCNNPSHKDYPNYGGRGVAICDRWGKFENFLADMGERKTGTTIDRIDVDGNYDPGNCRWADPITQNRNRRNVRVRT